VAEKLPSSNIGPKAPMHFVNVINWTNPERGCSECLPFVDWNVKATAEFMCYEIVNEHCNRFVFFY